MRRRRSASASSEALKLKGRSALFWTVSIDEPPCFAGSLVGASPAANCAKKRDAPLAAAAPTRTLRLLGNCESPDMVALLLFAATLLRDAKHAQDRSRRVKRNLLHVSLADTLVSVRASRSFEEWTRGAKLRTEQMRSHRGTVVHCRQRRICASQQVVFTHQFAEAPQHLAPHDFVRADAMGAQQQNFSQGRKNARMSVTFGNGTEIRSLLRSFERALYKDEAAAGSRPLPPGRFSSRETPSKAMMGTIYVLRSKSRDPQIAPHRGVLHKIGVAGGNVAQRVASAAATYLLADVEIVATYSSCRWGSEFGGACRVSVLLVDARYQRIYQL